MGKLECRNRDPARIISIAPSPAGSGDPRVVAALTYICASYSRADLTLESISRDLNISRQRIGALIKKEMGVSFRQLLRTIRVARAKELLRDKSLLVKQIAHDVGYTATANFVRDFRDAVGIPPGLYRADPPKFPL